MQSLKNKPVCLGLSILDIRKTVTHEFWYDYIKPKCKSLLYGYKQLYCSCKTDDIYKDIAKDVKQRSDTSNYEIDRPLPIGKNKKVIALM